MQVYKCSAALVREAGWGAVRDLTPVVLPCLLLELYGSDISSTSDGRDAKSGGGKAAKKRKRARTEQDELAGIGPGSSLLASAQVLQK